MSTPPPSNALTSALASADKADARLSAALRRMMGIVIVVLSAVVCCVVIEGFFVLRQGAVLQHQNGNIRANQVATHSLLKIVTAQSAALKAQGATLAALSARSATLNHLAAASALSRKRDEQFFYAICQGVINSPNTSAASRNVLRHLSACQTPR